VKIAAGGAAAMVVSAFVFLSVAQIKDFLATGVAVFMLDRAPAPIRFTAMILTLDSTSFGRLPMTIGLLIVPSGNSVHRTPSSTEYR
jgi:hypothetical protein